MLNSDLKVYKAKSNGRMSGTEQVISGVVQNVFPHVTSSQRAAGWFDYFKTFWKVGDDTDGSLLNPMIFIDAPTAGNDYVLMFEMDQRTRVADITGYATGTDTERKYSSAYLMEDITAGASTIVLLLKNAAMGAGNDACFEEGDTIILTDKATADALTGNEEVLTIAGSGSVVVDGTNPLKLTITVVETIANSYTAATSPTPISPRVSSVIVPTSDLKTSFTTPVVTSSAGTFTSDTGYLTLDNISTPDEDWTLTFTDATNFTLTGDSLGTIGTGAIGAEYAPNNSDFTKPYFTIGTGAWGGTFLAGDTVTFTTHPASHPIGQKRVVPAASGSLANNKTTQVLSGESVE